MTEVAGMRATVNGKTLRWDTQHVVCPSGYQVQTKRFPVLRFEAREALRGYEYYAQRLAGLGLTAEDVIALAESPDPVVRQLMSRPEDRIRCSRCRRVLWDAESIRLGMGPECRRKG